MPSALSDTKLLDMSLAELDISLDFNWMPSSLSTPDFCRHLSTVFRVMDLVSANKAQTSNKEVIMPAFRPNRNELVSWSPVQKGPSHPFLILRNDSVCVAVPI